VVSASCITHRVHVTQLITGGKLIKENVSVLEDHVAGQTPATTAGNVAGKA